MHSLQSTSNDRLRALLRAAAAADALMTTEWLRCYSYDANWSEGVQLARYDNGSGDSLIVVFVGDSVIVEGFDHESAVSPYARPDGDIFPGMYDGVPAPLMAELRDDALLHEDVTFCLWRETSDGPWHTGNVDLGELDDGWSWLSQRLLVSFEDYDTYARAYFEQKYDEHRDAVRAIFDSAAG